jgi:thiosulfate/3-mercaptopyruvate sulfurtransferase
MPGYAHPESLVSTAWVAGRLGQSGLLVIEVSLDSEGYSEGVIPGAALWHVWGDLLDDDERVRDDPASIAKLLGRAGLRPDTTIVLYGDAFNWGAALAFWLLRAAGHRDVRLMDGGREKWLAEGRSLSTDPPEVEPSDYPAGHLNSAQRARRDDVLAAIGDRSRVILDVRLPEEYDGVLFRPSGPPGDGQRAGHIPGAVHVPWETAVNADGTFKAPEVLHAAYATAGITGEREIIPYCTVGGRSGHTWFVLTQLLGYPTVRLYDASWAEWGQTSDLPIATPAQLP